MFGLSIQQQQCPCGDGEHSRDLALKKLFKGSTDSAPDQRNVPSSAGWLFSLPERDRSFTLLWFGLGSRDGADPNRAFNC